MQIKLTNTLLLIIFVVIFGYITILYSCIVSSATDSSAMIKTIHEMKLQIALQEQEISTYKKHPLVVVASSTMAASPPPLPTPLPITSLTQHRDGVIILGMHRSGTSIIGGLMSKMGLQTGGPLIRPAVDNEKGFFERIDVVNQNDLFMRKQKVHYAYQTENYDHLKGIQTFFEEGNFNEGRRALAFLNTPSNFPYMLKDPRLCITLRTWLPLLNTIPAILFTYRHPLDVALSLHNRAEEHFRMGRGLKLW